AERARRYSEAANDEQDKLKREFGEDAEKIEQAMAAWRKGYRQPHRATLMNVADHIDHIRTVAGIDHLGIGSDFDGFRGATEGLEDVSCYPALLAELIRRGYSDNDLKKLAGLNVIRVLRDTEKVAAKLKRENQ